MSSNTTIPQAEAAGDAALLTAFADGGDAGAFTALVQRYHGLVESTARRILKDDAARDVAQEVFVHLVREARRVRPGALGAWLHRTAVRSALNELRRTKRRHSRELTAMNETPPDNSREPLPEHWTEALEHLDEAMNHLSDTERQCIIGKFHHDQPLQEIAVNAGKSVDAARMTIQRALEKMCSFLRRRGVALSAAALASGLSTELARAGAVLTRDAAAALSVRVLSAAKSAGSSAAVTLLTTALMTKPALLTIAAVLAFAFAAGAGYLANKPDKPAAPPAKLSGGPASSGASPPATGSSGKESSSSSVQLTAVEQVVARLEALWKKKEEINQRGRRSNPPLDRKEAANMLAEMEALMQEGRSVTSALDAATLPGAVAIVAKRKGESTGFLLTALFEHWAGLDAETARTAAAKLPKELAAMLPAAVARGWAMTDPQAALAAVEKWHPGDRQSRNMFLQNVFVGWNRTAAAGAVRALANLPTDDQLLVVREFEKLVLQPAQFAAARPEMAKLEDEVLRGKLVNAVTEKWARFDAPAAAAWFDSIVWQNPGAGFPAAMELAEEWMRSGLDTTAAADWAWSKVPDEMRAEFVKNVQRNWAAQDRTAAEAWMNKHGITPAAAPVPGHPAR